MQPGTLHLLDAIRIPTILVCCDDFRHFLRAHRETRRGRPDAVAVAVEDRGAVDVAGADEADAQGG